MSLINATAIPSGATAYELQSSLRFNEADVTYLSRTTDITAAGRKKFTISCWIKVDAFTSGSAAIFRAEDFQITLEDTGKISLFHNPDTMRTSQVLRDPSSWYHLVFAVDTNQSTASNRGKIYVNGVLSPSENTAYPASNGNALAASGAQYIGSNFTPGGAIMKGYLAEYHFLEDIAATPSDFGETGDYGEWKPKEYSGSHGTNGFYLPFKQDHTVEGTSTVLYIGNSASRFLPGFGFKPDLVIIKNRLQTGSSNVGNVEVLDAIRGDKKLLRANTTGAEIGEAGAWGFDGFTTDGIKFLNGGYYEDVNNNTKSYVAWAWDMGGSNASNTTGSINSTVRANPSYGQSIVSWTGSGANATIGHGLSSAPEFVILKNRDDTANWGVFHKDLNDGTNAGQYNLFLNEASGEASGEGFWNNTIPASDVFSVGSANQANGSSDKMIAYCFHSVAGYSSIGSYTGNSSTTGASVTTGFAPAFLFLKKSTAANWFLIDNTRSPTNPRQVSITIDNAQNESYAGTTATIDFNANGFQIKASNNDINANGVKYRYIAFADNREFSYWLDQSGNNNDWTSNNLTDSDVMVDSPTNNFCTVNPLDVQTANKLKEGNLWAMSGLNRSRGTMAVSSGKWYYEVWMKYQHHGSNAFGIREVGGNAIIANDTNANFINVGHPVGSGVQYNLSVNGSQSTGGEVGSVSDGDIIGVMFDVDAQTISFKSNNSAIHSSLTNFNYSACSNMETVAPFISVGGGRDAIVNFGQDSSFAGFKTAQGKQDSNDIGDFYYEPPNGYLALCTSNLPDVAVTPSEHFNAVLYTGNGSTQNITTVGFLPDFTWIKNRQTSDFPQAFDSLRGVTQVLLPSESTSEATNDDTLTHFLSNGFTTGDDDVTNTNGEGYVAWNWKAGGNAAAVSSNTEGSINTTDTSANVDSGFSISTYIGTGSAATIGHGLSKAPEMYIIRQRNLSGSWWTYHKDVGATHSLRLDNNSTAYDDSTIFNDTAPTADVLSIGTYSDVNRNTGTFLCYAFHSVEGYSKFSSYIGNGSADGSYVHLGFRPRFFALKRTDSADSWVIFDSAREPENEDDGQDLSLKADTTDAEAAYGNIDFLSNGVKIRITAGYMNENNSKYIYMAFAEVPAKYSNAR